MRARIRTLKPAFWEDRRIISLSRDARLTAIALLSAADDRGRLECSAAAIRTYAFPRDRLTDHRVLTWIGEVVETGFCLSYEDDDWPYLWLPNFWRHQVINKASESELPPHPEDPYGHLPVRDALMQFREDYRSDSGSTTGVVPTLARTRASFPFPSVVDVEKNNNGVKVSEDQAERALFEYWQERCGHPAAKFGADRRSKLRSRRREGYTDEQIRQAIDGAAKAAHVSDTGRRFDDIELICRSGSKLESFIARASSPRSSNGRHRQSPSELLARLAASEAGP